jgi:5-methylcytosine-specific restriction endonuclease McrA
MPFEKDEASAAARIEIAVGRLVELAQELRAGNVKREDVSDVVNELRGAVVMGFGPKPKAKAGEGGKWKMLDHLKANIGTEQYREYLAVIADIDDWARRIRELRVEHGYDIEYMRDGMYVLHSRDPDEGRAKSWKTANTIRRGNGSVTSKIEKFFLANVGVIVRRDQLDYIANDKKEATRRARELRDEEGWPIISHVDDPNLRPSEYMLISDDPDDWADPNQREYPVEVRTKVFKRDGYRCQECKRTREDALAAGDTRFILEADHIVGVADPAKLTDEQKSDPSNLRTLCHRCHAKKTGGFQRKQRARRRRGTAA